MIRLANENNLIPQAHKLTVEEQSKGGQKSVVARREKKTFRELTELVLTTKNNDEDLRAFAAMFGIEDPDNKLLTVLGMVKAAIGGNHNAFDRLIELSGENNESSDNEELKQANLLKAIKKAVKGGN